MMPAQAQTAMIWIDITPASSKALMIDLNPMRCGVNHETTAADMVASVASPDHGIAHEQRDDQDNDRHEQIDLRAISLNFGSSSSRMPRMPSFAASKSTMKKIETK
jgi:hypothetical protein